MEDRNIDIEAGHNMNDMPGFRMNFYISAGLAGLKIIPDDKCCRLLAWLYAYGGGNEQVLDSRVSDAVFYAQGRLNLLGGEKPNADLLPVLQGYIKEITGDSPLDFFCNPKNGKYDNPPAWIIDLEKEFGIEPHRSSGK
jgi:hypothetical protein